MAGRPFKIVNQGIGNRVQELRASGYGYKEIEKQLREEFPNVDITYSSIRRYLKGLGKEYSQTTPSELIDTFNLFIQDILYKINLMNSISKNEKQAIKHFITHRKRIFEKSLYKAQGIVVDMDEKQLITDLLLQFSNNLCWDCMHKVSAWAKRKTDQIDADREKLN